MSDYAEVSSLSCSTTEVKSHYQQLGVQDDKVYSLRLGEAYRNPSLLSLDRLAKIRRRFPRVTDILTIACVMLFILIVLVNLALGIVGVSLGGSKIIAAPQCTMKTEERNSSNTCAVTTGYALQEEEVRRSYSVNDT